MGGWTSALPKGPNELTSGEVDPEADANSVATDDVDEDCTKGLCVSLNSVW